MRCTKWALGAILSSLLLTSSAWAVGRPGPTRPVSRERVEVVGSGTVTSITATNGAQTSTGSAITTTGTIRGARCIKHITATSYTVLTGDRACLVTFSNASPIAVTLPQAGTTGFEADWFFIPLNLGTGQVTITPDTSQIQNAPDIDLETGQGIEVTSDGSHYFYNPGIGLTAETQGLAQVGANGKTDTTAVSFATAWKFLDGNGDGFAIYTDPTDGPKFVCVDNNVENACTSYTRELAANQTIVYQDSGGTPIFTLTENTGELTNVTLDVESTGNAVRILQYRFIPFAACQAGTASTIWDLPASNAPVAACKGTNATKGVLEFADGATDLATTLVDYLNEDWVGGIEAKVLWESASTSTNNVLWGIAIACAGPGDDSDPAFTDDDFAVDANNATANTYNETAFNTVTTTGTCTAGDMMHIRFKRRLSQAGDTLAATAQAIGIALRLREEQ